MANASVSLANQINDIVHNTIHNILVDMPTHCLLQILSSILKLMLTALVHAPPPAALNTTQLYVTMYEI